MRPTVLPSFFLAGFECATQMQSSGARLDLAEATGHIRFAGADYELAALHGLHAARDGFPWPKVHVAPERLDLSVCVPMLQAADAAGVEVIWDLCHYGYPDWLDLSSPSFVTRFAQYARSIAELVRNESAMPPRYCPINEISFWAWAGGDRGALNPFWTGRANELKRQLVRATLAAIAEIKRIDPNSVIFSAEPMIRVAPGSLDPTAIAEAQAYHLAQFEATDMLTGAVAPELGGWREAIDVMGVNYYPDNQWALGRGTVPLGHHSYRALSDLLIEWSARYKQPLLLAETGAEGSARAAWLHYVADEVHVAAKEGVLVHGICLYPVLDYPGWDDSRSCPVGLFGHADEAGCRPVCTSLLAELQRQQRIAIERHASDQRGQRRDTAAA